MLSFCYRLCWLASSSNVWWCYEI